MIVNDYFFKVEKEKISLFFISQTGHGKPAVNILQKVWPNAAAKLKSEVAADNTMFRVFSLIFDHDVAVIYKKHYNTRDNAAAIREAYQKIRDLYPDQVIKIPNHNKAIFAALENEPNIEFYTKLSSIVKD